MWLLLAFACRQDPVERPLTVTEPTDTAAVSPFVFAGDPPSNLLMISVDTLRKSELGFYGGAARSDRIDALLATSVHLDDHMQCSSWTYASTGCTLMGTLHEQNGYMPILSFLQPRMPAESRMLAHALTDAGYFTMIHSANEWLGPRWGTTNGHLVVEDYGSDAVTASRAARERLLAERGDRPFALHLHVTEPHAAYDPPDSYLVGIEDLPPVPWDLSVRDEHYGVNAGDGYADLSPELQDALKQHLLFRYRADIAWLDDKLATILDEYEAAGLLDDTLVVFWTDHGEAFWEHGHQTHAWDLYPQENDAVLAFWAKNLEPMAWDGPTMAIDLAPTVLDVLGVPVPASMTGGPLGHAFEDRVRYASVLARAGLVQMVRIGDDALYYEWKTGAVARHDLAADPEALVNLYTLGDAAALPLWDAMTPYREALSSLVEAERVHPPGLP